MALGPLPDVDHVARVRINGTNNGTPWVALHYWHYLAAVLDAPGASALAIAWVTAINNSLLAAFAGTVTFDTVEVWDLSNREGAQGSAAAGLTGTRAGTHLPTNIAAVASWKVNSRWRGGHARTYWPAGVTQDVTNGHLWSSAARAAFEAANGAYRTAINGITVNGSGGYLTLVRYVHTPGPGQPPQYFVPPRDLPIVDVLIDARLDSQRRRLGPDL